MKYRHERAISGNTHFRINVFIALCNQRDGLVLLFGGKAKNLESSIETVVGFIDGIDNAKALDNGKTVPSKVLENSLAAVHVLMLRGGRHTFELCWAWALDSSASSSSLVSISAIFQSVSVLLAKVSNFFMFSFQTLLPIPTLVFGSIFGLEA